MSLPLNGNASNHAKYINHIRELFDEPSVITNWNLLRFFEQFTDPPINIYLTTEIEGLKDSQSLDTVIDYGFPGANRERSDAACIMLTSGSTGKSKAVQITHDMILKSIEGKSKMQ